ncbi:hypothetical protein BKA57DRAFT_531935 [Linnemannia elongata]|nr:hypothetical protein BKA57DRAFT_531935 [Linnemannia elongata]
MTAEHQQEQQQQQQYRSSKLNDTVLIVGAGIAGIIPALLLEKADFPYDIYERAAKSHDSTHVGELSELSGTKSGSALYYNTTTARIFKQVGIYDELYALVKNKHHFIQIASDQGIDYKMDFKDQQELFGSKGYIISRPMLYDILRRQVSSSAYGAITNPLPGSDKKLTMGDLINWTPKEFISKVMLEERSSRLGIKAVLS